MDDDNKIVLTEDGSHSLESGRFGVTYHSVHGAIQESQHVFLDAGLRPWLEDDPTEINIVEMGFGTGLNAYLTLLEAQRFPDRIFRYLTLEKYPIDEAVVQQLNYPELLGQPDHIYFSALHGAEWEREVTITDNFFFHKRREDLLEANLPADWAHCVFFDAFAPGSQPELWETEALKRMVDCLRPGGNLTTYCAKGVVKRSLRSLDLTVEALPGPPGKREMTRAVK